MSEEGLGSNIENIRWQLTLTLTLLDVGVELVQSSHGDLPDLRVEQELHQGCGDVFTGRHAGGLGNFTLGKTENTKQKQKKLKSG